MILLADFCGEEYLSNNIVSLKELLSLDLGEIKLSGKLYMKNNIEVKGNLNTLLGNIDSPYYYGMDGPTSISYKGVELPYQSVNEHPRGFGNPVGEISNILINGQKSSLEHAKTGDLVKILYKSGVRVEGVFNQSIESGNKILMIRFKENSCVVFDPDESTILFQKEWGTYDLIIDNKLQYFKRNKII